MWVGNCRKEKEKHVDRRFKMVVIIISCKESLRLSDNINDNDTENDSNNNNNLVTLSSSSTRSPS